MRVGLLGGTFDPVHNGHLKLAQSALKQTRLSCVYLILSPQSPFKKAHQLTPVRDRKKWLEAGLKNRRRLHLGKWELNRKGPSFTVQTLRRIKKEHPSWELVFILGSDSFQSLGKWKNPEGILKAASILVGRRPGASKISIPVKWKSRVSLLKGVFPDISSTKIRAVLQKNPAAAKKWIPLPVYRSLVKSARYA